MVCSIKRTAPAKPSVPVRGSEHAPAMQDQARFPTSVRVLRIQSLLAAGCVVFWELPSTNSECTDRYLTVPRVRLPKQVHRYCPRQQPAARCPSNGRAGDPDLWVYIPQMHQLRNWVPGNLLTDCLLASSLPRFLATRSPSYDSRDSPPFGT